MRRRWYNRSSAGISSRLFSGLEIGCLGGFLFWLFITGAMLGLVALVWWGRG